MTLVSLDVTISFVRMKATIVEVSAEYCHVTPCYGLTAEGGFIGERVTESEILVLH